MMNSILHGRSLLVSDVDGTLLGDDWALMRFTDWYEPLRDRLRLVYNSGRFVDSVFDSVRSTALPEPHAVIGGVGTEIHDCESDRPLDGWSAQFHRWDPDGIRRVLASVPELEPQPDESQSEFKLSYFAHDLTDEFLDRLRCKLEDDSYRVNIVYSSNRDLDVLPAAVDKGSAAAFLARQWGFKPDQIVSSGDSGNDRPMFEQGFRGIVVANAHPDLKALGGPNVYHAELACAAGVQEGLEHWLETPQMQTAAH